MAVLEGLFNFLKDHPSIILVGIVLYCLVFYISLLFSKGKPGKNPFYGDTRKAPQPVVHDKTIRDKVIKQGE